MDVPCDFVFGAQYYRAPTPGPECWEKDLARMHSLGMNSVKFWVQWRWSHRAPEAFYFDDLDQLMDLAAKNSLAVTLNVILDVSPEWLFGTYPDAKQIMNNGRVVEPYAVAHRQIGGHPGPCYNHPGTLVERKKFFKQTITHFSNHPAMAMWDIWNEPELCFPQRSPDIERLVCYCPYCIAGFRQWLKNKYETIRNLNQVWGRCYSDWDHVEAPRATQTFTDFIDWRDFHVSVMTNEAAWRLEAARAIDPKHHAYLHVVSNTLDCWNTVGCAVDDFDMAALHGPIFAASTGANMFQLKESLSAARGRTFLNVESHINFGSTAMHQRVLGLSDVLQNFIIQIGAGVKGFMLWQFRSEILGSEAPAWGVVRQDGSDRPVTTALEQFWKQLEPYAGNIMSCKPEAPAIGLWQDRKNEVFHFCLHQNMQSLTQTYNAYIDCLTWANLPFGMVSGTMLEQGDLDNIKLLILPAPYYLSEEAAHQLDAWVRAGGVVLTEAHCAGYNATTGRHSLSLPGCGLAESWALSETETSAPMHMRFDQAAAQLSGVAPDVLKAFSENNAGGSNKVLVLLSGNSIVWGRECYAQLGGNDITILGNTGDAATIVGKNVGKGAVIYCGSTFGPQPDKKRDGLRTLISLAASKAGIVPIMGLSTPPAARVRADRLSNDKGIRFITLINRDDTPATVSLEAPATFKGIFTGKVLDAGQQDLELGPLFADIFTLT